MKAYNLPDFVYNLQVSDFLQSPVNYKASSEQTPFLYYSSAVQVQAGRERGAGNWSLGTWHIRPLAPCQGIHPAWAAPPRLPSPLLPAAAAKVNLISVQMSYFVFLAERVSGKLRCGKFYIRKMKEEIIFSNTHCL